MNNKKDIAVVKYGSNSVANEGGISRPQLRFYAEQIAELAQVYSVVLVSSGAIATGRSIWNECYGQEPQANLQTLATLGSGELFMAWQNELKKTGLLTGQVLVTHHDIEDAERVKPGNKLKDLLQANINSNVISLINENDALSDVEIMELKHGGDNDGLSAHMAQLLRARHLCLMTGVQGVLDKNGELIRTVSDENINGVLALTQHAAISHSSRGGMYSKVKSAYRAATTGTNACIASSDSKLMDVINQRTGTHFQIKTAQNIVE